jgi:hypothetical protein
MRLRIVCPVRACWSGRPRRTTAEEDRTEAKRERTDARKTRGRVPLCQRHCVCALLSAVRCGCAVMNPFLERCVMMG